MLLSATYLKWTIIFCCVTRQRDTVYKVVLRQQCDCATLIKLILIIIILIMVTKTTDIRPLRDHYCVCKLLCWVQQQCGRAAASMTLYGSSNQQFSPNSCNFTSSHWPTLSQVIVNITASLCHPFLYAWSTILLNHSIYWFGFFAGERFHWNWLSRFFEVIVRHDRCY